MRALMKKTKGKENVEIVKIDVPEISEDEVLIKVEYAGICGTDIGIYLDKVGQVYYPPVVLGHEFSGTITDIGKEVDGWKVGDRVVAEPQTKACGKCSYCRTGNIGMCNEKRSPGWGTNGGMAKYIKMQSYLLHKIPDKLSFKVAAIAEPLTNAMHAVNENTHLDCGDFCVIFGPGPLGILSQIVAKNTGAYKIIMVGRDIDEKYRFGIARNFGADHTLNSEKIDVAAKILDITEGKGADFIVESSGSGTAINTGIACAKKQAKIAAIGFSVNPEVSINWNLAVAKNLNIHFQYSATYTSWERTLKLLNSQIPFEDLITYTADLSEWKKAFDDIISGNAMKILLKP